jgi:hypothetical protein
MRPAHADSAPNDGPSAATTSSAGRHWRDDTSALFVAGGIAQLTIAFVSGELPIERAEFVERLARYSLGVITTSRAAPSRDVRSAGSTKAPPRKRSR